jgi:hypothetical protein
MSISIIREISPPALILPKIDVEKARAFFEFRTGYYVAGEGYIPYQLMAVMVDEATLDTVAYFDFVKTKNEGSWRYVVSMRFEVIGNRIAQTWRSKEKTLFYSQYIAVQARSAQHLQEVARLCNF